MENVILEKQGHVSIITINREKALNALSTAVLKDLEEAVNTVEADKDTYCAVITGAGSKSFVAGADIAEMKDKTVEEAPYIALHVVTSMLDLMRVFDLIYQNCSIILLVANLPPAHLWEDFLEFMGYCGISNVNERVHYVVMRDLRTGNNISNKLLCDMRSITQVKRIIANRTSFIVPHLDWHAERRLSVDLECPIFGVVDTDETQSRQAIKDIFGEAGIVFPLSTREHRNVEELLDEMRELMRVTFASYVRIEELIQGTKCLCS